MRVLIADKLPAFVASELAAAGCDLRQEPKLDAAALPSVVQAFRPAVLIVRSTRVDAAAFAPGCLGLVVRAGAGTNTIDVSAASAAGVYVSNCPGRNAAAVAELTIGLLVAVDRRIPDAVAALRAGRWEKGEFGQARGLRGRRLGVVGCGGIGLRVIEAAGALGMDVHAWNRSDKADAVEALGATFHRELTPMLDGLDAVTLHVAAGSTTRGMCDRAFFAALPDGAIFLNTARGDVVDEDALIWAIRNKGIRAGLDVLRDEPTASSGEIAHPLLAEAAVIATPHVGASTDEAQEAVARETLRIVRTYQETGAVPNVVNVSHRSPSTHLLVVRHANRVGVLSAVFSALKDASINVEETQNIVFDGARACIARIAIDAPPAEAVLERIRAAEGAILGLELLSLNP